MSSRWRYGCGEPVSIFVPRGFDYREVTLECGSTAPDGGVIQCEQCAQKPALTPPPVPEYGDAEWER